MRISIDEITRESVDDVNVTALLNVKLLLYFCYPARHKTIETSTFLQSIQFLVGFQKSYTVYES